MLHGSSSVPQDEVDTINKFGGKLPDAVGIPEEQLRQASESAVCKINIDSDSRLAMTSAVRKVFAEKPAEFDPRKYLGPARDNMQSFMNTRSLKFLVLTTSSLSSTKLYFCRYNLQIPSRGCIKTFVLVYPLFFWQTFPTNIPLH